MRCTVNLACRIGSVTRGLAVWPLRATVQGSLLTLLCLGVSHAIIVMYVASERGHTAAITLLIENGGDVNQATNNGTAPVYIASQEGHTAAIKLLIENGGDVNQAMNDGRTPVYLTVRENDVLCLMVRYMARRLKGDPLVAGGNGGDTPWEPR